MGKIYEALEYTKRHQKKPENKKDLPLRKKIASQPTKGPKMKEEMIRLFQNIDPCVSNPRKRIIQFIGSREGEGTSTVAREFAEVAAKIFNKTVLLLDADRDNSTQCQFYNIELTHDWSHTLLTGKPIETAVQQLEDYNLFVGGLFHKSDSISKLLSSSKIDFYMETLKQRFDIIVVDSPPATLSSDGLAMSSKVDGIIFVLEAEKTRWPIAEKTKEEIIKAGGKILGILFNRRKFYIPPFIYQRL